LATGALGHLPQAARCHTTPEESMSVSLPARYS
jgi:hypothetical protein